MNSQADSRGDNPFIGITPRERSIALGVMVFFVLLVGALNLRQGRMDVAAMLLASVVQIGLLATPLVLYRGQWGWFHPIIFFPLWAFATGVVPSAGALVGGLEGHSALPGMGSRDLNYLVVQGILLQALGWGMFYVGATTGPAHGWGRTVRIKIREPRGTRAKILLVAGASVAGLVILIQAAGGLDALLLQRGLRADQRIGAELGGQWAFLVRSGLPTACLVWLGLRPDAVRTPLFWLLFCGGLAMAFAATGSRGGIILPIVIAVGIWILRKRRIPYVWVALLAVVGLIGIGLGGEFRTQTFEADTLEEVSVGVSVLPSFMAGAEEFIARGGEQSALTAILGKVPGDTGLLYGRSYLSVPAAPIPSRVWPEKPEAGGRLTGEIIFGRPEGGGGVPPGTVGEAFWNFHVPGVIVVFFLWGRLAKRLGAFYREHAGQGGIAALYAITLFVFAPNTVAFYGWFHSAVVASCAIVLFCGFPRIVRTAHPLVGVRGGKT